MATRRDRPAAPSQLEAYVLHHYDWSESSLILELFTRERGRVAVVAKGAKRPTSQLRPILLPFHRLSVSMGRTPADDQGDIHVLRQAEWVGGGPVLPPSSLFQGFYLHELLLKFLQRGDAHPALFDAYTATLPALAHGDEWLGQAGLRAFELTLLRETGVLPELALTTLAQRPVQAAQAYTLRADSGLTAVDDGGIALGGQAWLDLQAALDGGEMLALQRACAPHLATLRTVLRGLLHYHLGSHRLRTRDVMHSVQRLADGLPGGS